MSHHNKLHTCTLWNIDPINQQAMVFGSRWSGKTIRKYNMGYNPTFKHYVQLLGTYGE